MLKEKLSQVAGVLALFAVAGAVLSPAAPAGARTVRVARVQAPAIVAADRLADPGRVLPAGWSRSPDEAVTVAGDATGLHVMVATEAAGYSWRTVATLGVRGAGAARLGFPSAVWGTPAVGYFSHWARAGPKASTETDPAMKVKRRMDLNIFLAVMKNIPF